MKKLSYTLATLAVIGFSLLPANAVEKEVNNDSIIPDATEQIKESIQPGYCFPGPPFPCLPGCPCNK